jgi:hypothetical protein
MKAGDFVTLSDRTTLEAKMRDGQPPTPENYQIKQVLGVRHDLFAWRFALLDEEIGLWLCAKMADRAVDIYLFCEGDWKPVSRQELIQTGDADWMFQDGDRQFFNDLRYKSEYGHDNGGNPVTFGIKQQGEITAPARWLPERSGLGEQIATIAEYSTPEVEKTANPELMILEVGTQDMSAIRFMLGRLLDCTDVLITR